MQSQADYVQFDTALQLNAPVHIVGVCFPICLRLHLPARNDRRIETNQNPGILAIEFARESLNRCRRRTCARYRGAR